MNRVPQNDKGKAWVNTQRCGFNGQSSHLNLSGINLKALSHLAPHLILILEAAGACKYSHFTNGKNRDIVRMTNYPGLPGIEGVPRM